MIDMAVVGGGLAGGAADGFKVQLPWPRSSDLSGGGGGDGGLASAAADGLGCTERRMSSEDEDLVGGRCWGSEAASGTA